jgi:hypothetical protein
MTRLNADPQFAVKRYRAGRPPKLTPQQQTEAHGLRAEGSHAVAHQKSRISQQN